MVRAIGDNGQEYYRDDDPAVGELSVFKFRGQRDLVTAVAPSGYLTFQPIDGQRSIKPKIVRIGTDKAHRIGPPGERFQVIFFDSFQVIFANFERARDRRQIVTPPHPGRTQVLPDRFKRCVRIPGDFPKMDSPTIEPAMLIRGQMRDFAHEESNTVNAPR
jgi:hypothetical protein